MTRALFISLVLLVTGEERLLDDRGQRIRDVRQGPDGALYIVTDEDRGELWKLILKLARLPEVPETPSA